MTKKHSAAVELGRLGGLRTSAAKTAAAQRNIKTRWAKHWLGLCDCGQDDNPDLACHAPDCFGYLAGIALRQKSPHA